MPLWARAIAAEKCPDLLPDHDAARILRESGASKPTAVYRLQYFYLNVALRHWNMANEIDAYVADHPHATVVELGCGLSCQRRQMAAAGMSGATNPWYEVDFPNVIALRQRHIDDEGVEKSIASDLNDFAWMDEVDFDPARGVFFTAAGLFYYFRRPEVEALLSELALRFPGGAIAFDATNARGQKGVNKEIEASGIDVSVDGGYFSLEDPVREVASFSPRISRVEERDFFNGYIDEAAYRRSPLTNLLFAHMRRLHLGFFVHADFALS